MATQMTVSASYPCPHCHVSLEARGDHWQGWVLCPECGRPGLPPRRITLPAGTRRAVTRQPAVQDESRPVIGGMLKDPAPIIESSARRTRPASASSASRLIVSTGLFVSVFLLLVAYLDRSSHSSAIFASLTVVFFLLLLRMSRSR